MGPASGSTADEVKERMAEQFKFKARDVPKYKNRTIIS
jgi:hypothetical protein